MSVLTCCIRGRILRSSIRLLKHRPKEARGEGGSVHCWHLQLNGAAAERSEAARQEKGIFWCQSTRSPVGGVGGEVVVVITMKLQRLESGGDGQIKNRSKEPGAREPLNSG